MIRRTGLALFWVFCFLSVIGWALATSDPWAQLTVRPKLGLAGHALSVKVFVPRHPENRELAVAVDCEDFFRSWQEALNGEDSRAEFLQHIENMPAGQCVIGATIYRIDSKAKYGVAQKTYTDTACFAGNGVTC